MTKINGLKLSLKGLLGDSYDEFLEQFISIPIEEGVSNGKIDIRLVKNLNQRLKEGGKDIFDIPAEQLNHASRHALEGGGLFRVRLPITEDLVIDNFVKRFSGEKTYRKTLDTERKIYELFKETELADLVTKPLFTNERQLLVSYPFINANSFLYSLASMKEDAKEAALKKVIGEYHRLSKELTEHKDIFEDPQGNPTIDKLMPYEKCLDKFVYDRLDVDKGSEEAQGLAELFSKYFGELSKKTGEVIHGDLNPANVILQGDDTKFIDFEEMRHAFIEFDYAKLLTKASVSEELEEKIVRHATKDKAEVHGGKASEQDVEESYKTYTLNRIAQELFTAVRYVKRSKEHENSESLFNMALVSYNLALKKIDAAVERGYVGSEFKESLEGFIKKHGKGLRELGDEFDEYYEKYNPHSRASLENVVSAPSLDLMLDIEPSEKEVNAELKKLRKGLRKRDWKKLGMKVATFALPFVLIGGAVASYFGVKHYKNTVRGIVAELGYKSKQTLSQQQRIKDVMAHHSKIKSNELAKQRISYMGVKFGDIRTAYLFFLDPETTYGVMQQTQTQDFDKIYGYIEEYRYKNGKSREEFYDLIANYEEAVGEQSLDGWMSWGPAKESYVRAEFNKIWEKTKAAYDAKKQAETQKTEKSKTKIKIHSPILMEDLD